MAAQKRAGHRKEWVLHAKFPVCILNKPQGTPQYIQLAFVSPVIPRKIHFTFQGGFVGTKCSVQSPTTGSGWETFTQIFPEDVNRPQTFDIPATNAKGTQKLKLVFEASSDFFGRLVVYDLRIEGDIIA